MQANVLYNFPLKVPVIGPVYAQLQKRADGMVGFAIKALPEEPAELQNLFSFFEIDPRQGTVSHLFSTLPSRKIDRMLVCYDETLNRWVLAVGRPGPRIEFYAIPSVQQQWQQVFSLDDANIGSGDIDLVSLRYRHNQFSLLFTQDDVAEVSDKCLYRSCWTSPETAPVPFQHISFCDVVVPHITATSTLLFLCQRVFTEEPAEGELRRGAGRWHLLIQTCAPDGTPLHQEMVADVAFPVRNMQLPEEDLLNWLSVRIYVMDNALAGENGEPLWVAALQLADRQVSRRAQGGLYCGDEQGRILFSEKSPLGDGISLCGCGSEVIGTDIFAGSRRLWKWSPFKGGKRHTFTPLNNSSKRVTLVTMEAKSTKDAGHFWCIEEYQEGVRLSKREPVHLQEQEGFLLKGYTLLDGSHIPYLRDTSPTGIIAHEDAVLLLCLNGEKQLQLVRVQ